METFKISKIGKDSVVSTEDVQGERITIANVQAFIFKEEEVDDDWGGLDYWNCSHLETGMRMASGFDKDIVISEATRKLNQYPETIEKGRQILISKGITLPINK